MDVSRKYIPPAKERPCMTPMWLPKEQARLWGSCGAAGKKKSLPTYKPPEGFSLFCVECIRLRGCVWASVSVTSLVYIFSYSEYI